MKNALNVFLAQKPELAQEMVLVLNQLTVITTIPYAMELPILNQSVSPTKSITPPQNHALIWLDIVNQLTHG